MRQNKRSVRCIRSQKKTENEGVTNKKKNVGESRKESVKAERAATALERFRRKPKTTERRWWALRNPLEGGAKAGTKSLRCGGAISKEKNGKWVARPGGTPEKKTSYASL